MKQWVMALVLSGAFCACGSTNPEGTRSGDCSDGVDNDNDGRIDCADDGCEAFTSCKRILKPKGSGLLSAQVKAAAKKQKEQE